MALPLSRFSGRQLLACLIALFVLPSLVEWAGWAEWAEVVLFTLVLISAVPAVGGRHRWVAAAVIVPGLVLLWLLGLGVLHPDSALGLAYLAYTAAMVVLAIARLLQFALAARSVDGEVLAAGVSVYLLLGLLWSFLYRLMDGIHPGTFHGGERLSPWDAFYFSLCTLTTAGYGDITPVTHPARMLAIMESITGVLYIGVLIARLVSLYSGPAARKET
ncbi:MAG TPA: potassium channel family protein [Opitutaceae bacterium]|nr:potassium channel family protein [Opitutaceae bacterium]